MRSIGIICEYNPFHNGHAAQLRQIREEYGPDTGIVCLMSGNYVQRGEPAIFPKQLRAEAAVLGGADLVLELPLTAALSSAEGFADRGVEILTAFGCAGLSFGSECGDRNLLMSTAKANLDPAFDALLRAELMTGCSYPTARQRAIEQIRRGERPPVGSGDLDGPQNRPSVGANAHIGPLSLPLEGTEGVPWQKVSAPEALTDEAALQASALSRPNDVLAVEYCKAILKQHSPMEPLPVLRPGSYHAQTLDPEAPSATALRPALLADAQAAHSIACRDEPTPPAAASWSSAVPSCLHELYASAPVHTMAAGERAVLAILRTLPDTAFAQLPFGSEGLWSKLMKNCRSCASVEEILEATKSKRYTLSRIRRMLLCAVLGLTEDDLARRPPYVRVLAFNDRGRSLLRRGREGLPLINAGETPPDPAYDALERRAAELYSLFSAESPRPGGEEARLRVVYHPTKKS